LDDIEAVMRTMLGQILEAGRSIPRV